MNQAPSPSWLSKLANRRLVFQYLAWTLSFSTVLTALMTVFEGAEYYRKELSELERSHVEAFNSHRQPLKEAIWRFDFPQTRALLDGIVALPTVDYVLFEGQDLSLKSGDRVSEGEEHLFTSFDLIKRALDGEHRELGKLTLYKRLQPIYDDVVSVVAYLLLFNFGKAFLTVAFSLWAFRQIVSKHMQIVAKFVRKSEPMDPSPGLLKLDRPSYAYVMGDEIDQVTNAINDMKSALARSIKARALVEHALRLSEENLRLTLDAISDAVIATDQSGRVVLLNPIAERYLHRGRAACLGEPISSLLDIRSEATSEPVPSALEVALESNRTVARTERSVLVSRNGKTRPIDEAASPILSVSGEVMGAVLVLRDVTHRRKIVAERTESDRMGSLAALAGGIAHDFNNSLAGPIMLLSLLSEQGCLPDSLVQHVTRSSQSLERAADLSNHLMTFAQDAQPNLKRESIEQIVEKSINLVRDRAPEVSYEVIAQRELWPCLCDSQQISRVLTNIFINAHHAMKQRGVIRISLGNVTVDRDRELWSTEDTIQLVRIDITDEGSGIEPDRLPRIFDPYFSTKKSGHGLGLFNAYTILTKHGGRIEVDSVLGQGTTFSLYLPSAQTADGGIPPQR